MPQLRACLLLIVSPWVADTVSRRLETLLEIAGAQIHGWRLSLYMHGLHKVALVDTRQSCDDVGEALHHLRCWRESVRQRDAVPARHAARLEKPQLAGFWFRTGTKTPGSRFGCRSYPNRMNEGNEVGS